MSSHPRHESAETHNFFSEEKKE